jgi:hypothetical protein
MTSVKRLIEQMRLNPSNVNFSDLVKVCEHVFGAARQSGTSHVIFKTPWLGDPRVNIQDQHGKAKAYQVRQVLQAIELLEGESE